MRWATEVTFQHHQIIIAIFRLPRNFEFKNAPQAQLCLLTPRLTSFHAHRLPPSSLSNGSGRTPGHSELQGLASHHELRKVWSWPLEGKQKIKDHVDQFFLGQDSPNTRHHAFAWWWATSFCGSHVLCVFWTPRTPSQLFYVRFQSFNLLWAVSEDQQPQAAAPAIASCGLVRFSTNPMSGSNIGVLSIWPTCVSCLIREYQMHLNM